MLESRSGASKRSFTVARGRFELKGGGRRHVNLTPTAKARRYLRDHTRLPVIAKVTSAESAGAAKQVMGIRKASRR